jgi:hypothetical protein
LRCALRSGSVQEVPRFSLPSAVSAVVVHTVSLRGDRHVLKIHKDMSAMTMNFAGTPMYTGEFWATVVGIIVGAG